MSQTIHLCPPPGEQEMPCCGRSVHDLRPDDYVSSRFPDVTCGERVEQRGRLLDLLVDIYDGASIAITQFRIEGVDELDEMITGQPGQRPDIDEVRAFLDRALR